MSISVIESHYITNRTKYVKRMTFRSGNPATAEDVVQSAYERAIIYYKSLKGGNIDAWMSMIMNNCLREMQNAEKGYSYRDEEEEETDDSDSDDEEEGEDDDDTEK